MNDWDLLNIRADIMLATDIEHLQAIDNYYEDKINNLQSKIDKAIILIDKYLEIVDNPDINMQCVKDILKEEI